MKIYFPDQILKFVYIVAVFLFSFYRFLILLRSKICSIRFFILLSVLLQSAKISVLFRYISEL